MLHLSQAEFLQAMASQEGALVEVCVTSASYEQWVAVLKALRSANFELIMKEQDAPIPPDITADVFSDDDDTLFQLSVRVGRQSWTTAFYSSKLIDFQGDPRDIIEVADINDLRAFMQVIANAAGSIIRMVPETLDYETVATYIIIEPDPIRC